MQTDNRGLPLTTSSAEAAANIDAAVSDFLDYGVGASGKLKAALDADPDCALAQCFRGYFMMMLEMRAVLPKVQQTVAALRARSGTLTRREQLHVAALEAWSEGEILKACAAWEEILADHPHDLLAMKLHHTMAFYTGRSAVMRAVIEGALGDWGESVPGLGYVEGMYAYALEECGAYGEAERWGRRSVARNPGDLWAIHSVAHVLEMQARAEEGATWLHFSTTDWQRKNPFKAHVWFHAALFAMARGDTARVLDLYDHELSSVNTDSYVDVSNQAAILKRLALMGVDVGERWSKLAAYSKTRMDDHMLPFRDLHFCLALAGDGDLDAARRHVASMRAFAAARSGWQADATRNIVIPLSEAMILAAEGRHGEACDLIWPLRHEFATIGGSNAQRDLFAQILCDAAAKGRQYARARTLLSERVVNRPSRRQNWTAYAEVLAALGDTPHAEAARSKALEAADAGA